MGPLARQHVRSFAASLLAWLGEDHPILRRLSSEAHAALRYLINVLHREVGAPVAACRTDEAIKARVEAALPTVLDGAAALGLVVMRELGPEPAVVLSELHRDLRSRSGELGERWTERVGDKAAGHLLLAVNTAFRAAARWPETGDDPELVLPLLRVTAAILALGTGEAVAPVPVAAFAREQALALAARTKELLASGRTAGDEPKLTTHSRPEDVALARAAFRAWLAREGNAGVASPR